MTDPAVGIHDHPTQKLGRRSPSLRPSVAVGEFLRLDAAGQLPAHPDTDPVPPLSYPMAHNDTVGDCVVAGLDHALQTIHAALGVPRSNWDDATLLRYYQTQNPGFTDWSKAGDVSVDQGMDIQTFLEFLVKEGTIVAFGRLDHANIELLKAATWVGLAIVTGEDLQVAQQNQTVWDYAPSDDWGGHCTTTVAYSKQPDQEAVVSWGEVVETTEAFVAHQVSEAWFVLAEPHLQHPAFRDGFDLAGFAQAVSDVTGGKVVVPVPPAPAPVPDPTPPVPTPGPAPDPTPPAPAPPAPAPLADFPFHVMDRWAAQPFGWAATDDAANAYRQWRRQHP